MSYDIHIEGVAVGITEGFKFVTFGPYPTPIAVQGMQKMVDRFLKCLCTPKGSDITDLGYGTTLLASLGGNVDAGSLQQLAYLAVQEAEEKIREYDVSNGVLPSERLSGAQIDDIAANTTGNNVDIFLLLRNAEGTTVRVLVPQYEQVARSTTQTG